MLVALRDRRGVGNLDVSFIEARHRVSRDLSTSASFPYEQVRAQKIKKKSTRTIISVLDICYTSSHSAWVTETKVRLGADSEPHRLPHLEHSVTLSLNLHTSGESSSGETLRR